MTNLAKEIAEALAKKLPLLHDNMVSVIAVYKDGRTKELSTDEFIATATASLTPIIQAVLAAKLPGIVEVNHNYIIMLKRWRGTLENFREVTVDENGHIPRSLIRHMKAFHACGSDSISELTTMIDKYETALREIIDEGGEG